MLLVGDLVVLKDFKIFFIIIGVLVIFAILLITYKLDNISSTPKVNNKKTKQRKTNEGILIEDDDLHESLTEEDLYEGIRDNYTAQNNNIRKNDEYDYSRFYTEENEEDNQENNSDEISNDYNNNYEENNTENDIDENNNFESKVDIFKDNSNDRKRLDIFENNSNDKAKVDIFEDNSNDNEKLDMFENNSKDKENLDIFEDNLKDKEMTEKIEPKENKSFDQTMIFDTVKEEKKEKKDEYDPFIEQLKNFVEPEQSDIGFFTTAPANSKNKKTNATARNEVKKETKVEKNTFTTTEKSNIEEPSTEIKGNDFLSEMEKTLMKNRNNRRVRKTVMSADDINNLEKENASEEVKEELAKEELVKEEKVKEETENKDVEKTTKKRTTKRTTNSKKTKE